MKMMYKHGIIPLQIEYPLAKYFEKDDMGNEVSNPTFQVVIFVMKLIVRGWKKKRT